MLPRSAGMLHPHRFGFDKSASSDQVAVGQAEEVGCGNPGRLSSAVCCLYRQRLGWLVQMVTGGVQRPPLDRLAGRGAI
jgi:hypothetical protein